MRFKSDNWSYGANINFYKAHGLGEHIWKTTFVEKVCAPKGTLFSQKTRFFTMFQKYVPDVITSHKRHIFFLEQIHIHMVFSPYKYASDANKCDVRTFTFIKKSHFFESIFPKNQPKFDIFLNICLTSVFTKITFCWILQILIIF